MKKRLLHVFIFSALLLFFCASTKNILVLPEEMPKVNIKLSLRNKNIPEELKVYQLRLDSLLAIASPVRGFVALPYEQDKSGLDYQLFVSIDNIYLVSPEFQKSKLAIRDSVYNKLNNRRQEWDTSCKPPSDLVKALMVGQKIREFNVFNAVNSTMQIQSALDGEYNIFEKPYPKLTRAEKKKLKNLKINPSMAGSIKLISFKRDSVVWKLEFNVKDEYDKFVNYDEQIDMLLRWLIGKIRFGFKTPFISDSCKIVMNMPAEK